MIHPTLPPRRTLWPLIAAVAAGTAFWMAIAGLSLVWRSAVLPAAVCLALEALAAFYSYGRPDGRLAATLSGVAQLIAFSAVASCLSYAAAATAGPLRDATLFGADGALGFDWKAYLAAADARPWFGTLLTLAYESLKPQIVLVVGILGLSGRTMALHRFLLAFVIATVVTILLSGLVPAMGVFAFLELPPTAFPHFHPAAADLHVAAMNGLRDGSLRELSLNGLQGIITFPSLHAALGVLLGAALWPVRWARWPALVVNALLVAATPLNGSHYFTDVIAGLAIAASAQAAAQAWIAGERVPGLHLGLAGSGTGRMIARP